MSSNRREGSAWLHGRASDLLLGCGGLYLLLLVPLAFSGEPIRLAQPLLLFPLLTLLVSGPHYGATLLRVYEDRHDRRAYAVFSIWATALIGAAFCGGLWFASLGTFLVTLYLTWSPWHYTGQNYGIAVMFLRRSGVSISTGEKRWIYTSFVSSFVLVALFMHSADGSARDLPVYSASEVVRFVPLGIPAMLSMIAVPLAALVYLSSLVASCVLLLRKAAPRDLLPFALLSLSQGMWFVLPLGAGWLGWQPAAEVFRSEFRTHYFMWIAMAHSIQYLWVTSYYAKQSRHWQGQPLWYAKVVASGSAIWMLPALLLGPLGVGPLSMDQGLAVLIAAGVNLHHFVLDGAIWKLKGRIAEVLIRSGRDESAESVGGKSLLRPAIWALCASGLLVQVFHTTYEARAASSRDAEQVQQALDRLAWLGLDTVQGRMRLGRTYLAGAQPERAVEQVERGLALTPVASGYVLLGQALLETGENERALAAFREAQTRSDQLANAHRGEATALLRMGDPAAALVAIDRAAQLAPDNPSIDRQREQVLERAETASGGRPISGP